MPHIKFKEKKVYYESYGEGEVIVILNGIMMSTLSWKPFIDVFSAKNRLILVDFLDQGKSDKMEGTKYTIETQAEVLKTLFNELNLSKVNLVGISYGGEVALHFAVKYERYIDRMVLFNTDAKKKQWLRDIGTAWNLSLHDPLNYYCTTIPVIYSPQFYNEKEEWMGNRKKHLVENVFSNKDFMDSMKRLTDSSAYHDVSSQISKVKVPTLIVSSEQDFITPIEEQRELHQLMENSHHIVIPNTGHASMYERPVLFASLVFGFLNLKYTEFNI